MKQLKKRLVVEKDTVESMACEVTCRCSCALCQCANTSSYYGTSYDPDAYYQSVFNSNEFDLHWQIQALT